MQARPVVGALGLFTAAIGVLMLTAAPFPLLYHDDGLRAILGSAAITAPIGLIAWWSCRARVRAIGAREAFAIATLAWVVVPLFGCLPYLLSGAIPSFTDAYFEAVSGFTGTGASIVPDVEILPHGILFWRAMTHWIGGLGIIVLALAVLPFLGVGGMQLLIAERSTSARDQLTPRLSETARLFGKLYAGITLAEVILLVLGGMPPFDALCHAFATISAGGFSVKNTSIAWYHSAYIDLVITFFMLVAGTNFALHLAAIRRNLRAYPRDNEFTFYMGTFGVAVVAITLALALGSLREPLALAVRHAAFNAASVMSCTGFANADFVLWPAVGQAILLCLMLPGACAGSAGGGMKTFRVMLSVKSAWGGLRSVLHPQAVVQVHHDRSAVRRETLSAIQAFVTLYIGVFCLGTLAVAATGVDLLSSISAVASCLAGCGPGLGTVGPMSDYAHLSAIAKWTLDLCMLMGRLEILTILILFTRSYWRD
jgi:trk system potassium uptake protein TrkH